MEPHQTMSDDVENALDDTDGWQQEAQAVINDVKLGVKDIRVSHHLTCTRTKIYLNVTTRENETLCVELTARGFRVVGKGYDAINEPEETFYETPYSLLSNRSALFREAFGANLIEKLSQLQRENDGANDSR